MTGGRPPCRCFSPLELLIAVGVFTVLVIVFFQLMQSSQSRMSLSANSLYSTQVAAKVAADLSEEARISTTLLELLEEFPDLTTADGVVEGQSVYFRHLKDRAPPWGVIDPAVHGGIVPADQTLYEELRPFRVKVDARRVGTAVGGDFTRHLAHIRVLVDWQEKSRMERANMLEVQIPSPVGPSPLTPLPLEETPHLQNRIRTLFFFGQPGVSLAAAVAERGAEYGVILNLGRIAVIAAELEAAQSAATQEIDRLSARRGAMVGLPSPELITVQMALARKFEESLNTVFLGLSGLEKVLQEVGTTYRRTHLGTMDPRPVFIALGRTFSAADRILPLIRQCAREYRWVLDDGLRWIRSRRDEEFARVKAVEAFRLGAELDPSLRGEYEDFIRAEKQRSVGRNPYWEKFFLREALLNQSPTARRQAFPNLMETSRLYREVILPGASLTRRLYLGQEP